MLSICFGANCANFSEKMLILKPFLSFLMFRLEPACGGWGSATDPYFLNEEAWMSFNLTLCLHVAGYFPKLTFHPVCLQK